MNKPLVIVEGFWGVGKSRLCRDLSYNARAIFIEEPKIPHGQGLSVKSKWFWLRHLERHRRALRLRPHTIIMERSVLSNQAFAYAIGSLIPPIPIWVAKQLRYAKIIFLDYIGDPKGQAVPNDPTVRKLLRNPQQIARYRYYFLNIVPKLLHVQPLHCIVPERHDQRAWRRLSIRIVEHIAGKQLPTKHECSAAAVVFNDDSKVLLLYDTKAKHFVLPQGHPHRREKLLHAAQREVAEESGYANTQSIRKLAAYSYTFGTLTAKINKRIYVYALSLTNQLRSPLQQEEHETYVPKFYSLAKAEALLRWEEDKRIIKRLRLNRSLMKDASTSL